MMSGLIKTMNEVKNQINVNHADLKEEISKNAISIEQLKMEYEKKKNAAKRKRGDDSRN